MRAPTRMIRGPQLARLLTDWRGGLGPEYQALAQAVRGLLVDGRLPLQLRLPAERELAAALDSSRTTVSAAYRTLRESGYLVSRRGAGSWTALPEGHRLTPSGQLTRHSDGELLDLSFAAPPAPPALADAVAEAGDQLGRYAVGHGYYPMGLMPLREAIAEWYERRGVATSPAQVVVTSGAQQAYHLALQILTTPGETALIESPTYPNAPAAARACGLRLASYGLGPDGWDAELLADAVRQVRPRVAYLVPDFHNPTGHVMPTEARARLVAAAHTAGTTLIVDETFVELGFGEQRLPPAMAAYDRHGRVLSLGSMSKAFWGGLRIGWIRGPASLMARLAASRSATDLGSPVLEQLIATALLARRDEVLPQRRRVFAAARDYLAGALADRLPRWRFTVPAGGVGLWVELDAPVSSALVRAAESHGLRLAPGPRFGIDGLLEQYLRLPFTLPQAELATAVDRLVDATGGLQAGPAGDWPPSLVVA
ncbi:MAG: PLP-dependent aminotransferase family protein [Micromonosporaceae bacterium]